MFVSQLTRDLTARERAAAQALTPGALSFDDAFRGFALALSGSSGPRAAAALFRSAIVRLGAAQKAHHACLLNCSMSGPRSGFLEVIAYKVARHPLVETREEGIIVMAYRCLLRRKGHIRIKTAKLSFLSWHMLGRLQERSAGLDILAANGIVIGCGLAGYLLRQSQKHADSAVHYTCGDITAAGILRTADDANARYKFFDVLTVLSIDDTRSATRQAQREQGRAIAAAVWKYLNSDNADPDGYADAISVLPARADDFVSA